MELKEIIRSDKDRLFVLDNECYIIFTADDISDEKPFIRIGNWIDLPPESIPLIENIIVTDSITGNPSHEQFNIDPKYLSTNRYIGSRQTVQSYLAFQKNFGLDLNNVSIVDVEKDLPYLSKEKSISSKDSFLGIFYHNGNFRVIYKDNNLFDLKDFEELSLNMIKKHELISGANKDSVRHIGAGIIVLENCTLFYKNRYFTSYMFPKEYLDYFNKLNIDPAKIRELLLPASNLLNITEFIAWSNTRKNFVKIISNSKDEFDSMQKLFPDVIIKREDFHGFSFDTGDGLTVRNYPGSINVKLTYRNVMPSLKNLDIAFLKEYAGIQEILKEKRDGIIVSYTIYEQASLFFRSTDTPVMIIDDGNKNISKLKGRDVVILNHGIQYEFKKFTDIDSMLQNAEKTLIDKEIAEFIITNDIEGIKKILYDIVTANDTKDKLEFTDIQDLLNIISFLRIYYNTTTDRKLSDDIRKIIQKANSMFDKDEIIRKSHEAIKITLFFYDYSIFEFYESRVTNNKTPETSDSFFERITADRIRFQNLLDLYKKTLSKTKKDFALLHNEINKRKEQYSSDDLQINQKEIRRNILKIRLKKIGKVALIILIIAIMALVTVTGVKYYREYYESRKVEKEKQEKIEAERIRIEKEKNEKQELVEKYGIRVSDHDIYLYANKVARKNGYREIEYKDLKEKNPNWIFPGNVFYLMDQEKVTVKSGDTLWDISDKKLMQINIEFYKLADKIEKAKDKNEKNNLLNKAQGFAFSKKHFSKIDEIRKMLNK